MSSPPNGAKAFFEAVLGNNEIKPREDMRVMVWQIGIWRETDKAGKTTSDKEASKCSASGEGVR